MVVLVKVFGDNSYGYDVMVIIVVIAMTSVLEMVVDMETVVVMVIDIECHCDDGCYGDSGCCGDDGCYSDDGCVFLTGIICLFVSLAFFSWYIGSLEFCDGIRFPFSILYSLKFMNR